MQITLKIQFSHRLTFCFEAESAQNNVTPAPPTLEERWDTIGPELSAVMREAVIPEVRPFDATLETPIDDQKYVCDTD